MSTGPIVRVTPHELHISEPEFYGKLFVTGAVRKSDTYPRFSRGTGFEGIFSEQNKMSNKREMFVF